MLDSESQLREAIQKMKRPGGEQLTPSVASSPAPQTGVEPQRQTAAGRGDSGIVAYICPMPEHLAIRYDKPGKCPICGMVLVPVSTEALAKLQPGGRVLYYTCPMPEHGDVRAEKAGKCPKCGMTMIPVMEPPHAPDPSPPAAGHEPKPLH